MLGSKPKRKPQGKNAWGTFKEKDVIRHAESEKRKALIKQRRKEDAAKAKKIAAAKRKAELAKKKAEEKRNKR